MSFKISQGLFSLDFIDYHAILGVPIDAEIKDIPKRYHAIARRLHPDSQAIEGEADRRQATELLSKWVNPAYEALSRERNHADYDILLRLKGQQALKQQETIVLTSAVARELAAAPDLDNTYKAALRSLAEKQYQQLNQTLDIIGQLSELNLIYLMRKAGKGEAVKAPQRSGLPSNSSTSTPTPLSKPASSAPKAAPSREAIVESYLRRAREFEAKQDYPKAIMELRDAIKLEPQNSESYSRLGVIYFKVNQPKMAKIHFEQALKVNPQDAVALEGKRRLEAPDSGKTATTGKLDAKGGKPTSKGSANTKSSGSGLFGLFGSKKK